MDRVATMHWDRETMKADAERMAACLRELESGKPSEGAVSMLIAIFSEAADLATDSRTAEVCRGLVRNLERQEWDQAGATLWKMLRLANKQWGFGLRIGGRHLKLVK